MPYPIVIPTNCLRRVNSSPATAFSVAAAPHPPPQEEEQQQRDEDCDSCSSLAMMLYSNSSTCDSATTATTHYSFTNNSSGSSRLMNMQGPGGVWPNGRNANDDDDDDTMPLDPPLHHWGYQGFARATRSTAAPFASPIVSQNQRESFARLQTAQALLSPRRRLDPLHAPAVDWNTAESYDDHDPLDFEQEDTKMSDPFPLEGPLDIYHDEYHQELDHDAHIPPAPSLETARYEMVDPPAAAAARSPPVAGPVRVCLHAGNKKSSSSRSSSRNRRSSRMPHKQPSKTEIASCSTKRAAEALRVWYKRFNELVDYRELTGDCNVPQKYSPNPALGIWVNKMRMEKKAFDSRDKKSTALTQEKIDALEDIGFTWARQKGDKLWEDKFCDLQKYAHEHGNCNVPTKYRVDTALGRWVSTQRKQYKEMKAGKRTLMTLERAQRLEALGFRWNAMEARNDDDAESP